MTRDHYLLFPRVVSRHKFDGTSKIEINLRLGGLDLVTFQSPVIFATGGGSSGWGAGKNHNSSSEGHFIRRRHFFLRLFNVVLKSSRFIGRPVVIATRS